MSDNTTSTFYIQIDNTGASVDHPVLGQNLIDIYGSIPNNYVPFNRTDPLDAGVTLAVYQTFTSTYTVSSDGVTWQDNWSAYDMNDDEKADMQQRANMSMANHPYASNYTAWVLNTDILKFQPPIPKPTTATPDGQRYIWQGSTNSWQLGPISPPNDGNSYVWNFDNWAFTLTNITTST
jgi:hypothetical protein